MKRIMLMVAGKRNRNRLQQWLSEQYELVVADIVPDLNEPFAIIVVDLAALEKHTSWIRLRRAMGHPATSPVLLITSRQGMRKISENTWRLIDDLILTPLDEAELLTRLAHMAWVHGFSLELKHKGETLTRIQAAVESTGDGVVITDPDGVAIYTNQAFYDLYGYALEELNIEGIFTTLFATPAIAYDVFKTVLLNESWSGEVQLRRNTGQLMPALLRADNIRDENGFSVGIIVVLTDMNRIRQIEASERQHRVLAESLRDTIATITSTLELEEVLDLIMDQVGQVVAHDAVNIMFVEQDAVSLVRSRDPSGNALTDALTARQFAIADSPILSRIVLGRQTVIVGDIRDHPSMAEAAQSGLRGYVGAPIFFRHEIIGLINIYSKNANMFNEAHGERLQTFAHLVGTAIKNARLFAQAQELAIYKERQRMAQNLHDAVSQTLFSASGIAQALPRLWPKDPDAVWPRLEQLERLTRGALAEMRMLLYELRPTSIHDVDLQHLIGQLAAGTMGRSSVDVKVNIEWEPGAEIPGDVHENLYHITQEGLNNVVKHAQATEAHIELCVAADHVKLAVSDNGCGFQPDSRTSTSLGINIMNERAEAIGAALKLDTTVGAGTKVTVVWPEGSKNGGEPHE